jgi:hypothetical protein
VKYRRWKREAKELRAEYRAKRDVKADVLRDEVLLTGGATLTRGARLVGVSVTIESRAVVMASAFWNSAVTVEPEALALGCYFAQSQVVAASLSDLSGCTFERCLVNGQWYDELRTPA